MRPLTSEEQRSWAYLIHVPRHLLQLAHVAVIHKGKTANITNAHAVNEIPAEALDDVDGAIEGRIHVDTHLLREVTAPHDVLVRGKRLELRNVDREDLFQVLLVVRNIRGVDALRRPDTKC